MGILLDGRWLARCIEMELAAEVAAIKNIRVPGLATVLVGSDPASKTYVASKHRAASRCGFRTFDRTLSATASQKEVIEEIEKLNKDPEVDGILVQLPLPQPLRASEIINAIHPSKDVDGLHPVNQGKLMAGLRGPEPCTPAGVMTLIDATIAGVEWGGELIKVGSLPRADLSGKRALVVGRSVLVGKPVALMLLERNATVIMAHSRTGDLEGEVRAADIVVPAVGKPDLIRREWMRDNTIVIDVGINRLPEGTLTGDVSKIGPVPLNGALAPVPGGVGPMTVASLLRNTLMLYKEHR